MKKIISVISVLFLCFPFFAKDLQFEDLINKAATEISEELEGQVETLAVFDVQTEYWAVSDYVVDELAHYFARRFGSGNVIAHDDYTSILIEEELKYQHSGAVSDETIQELGRELGVECVITGEFTELSNGWQLIVQATKVETKKVLFSWKGKVKKNDKEVKFQISKSQKSEKPAPLKSKQAGVPKNDFSVQAEMINDEGEVVSVLHPGDIIRFKITSNKNAYLGILCIDANGEEEWLPLESNYIRADESRIFPDIQGIVLKVQDDVFGKEMVKVYAAINELTLPKQERIMGEKPSFTSSKSRRFKLAADNSEATETVIEYKVER